MPASQLEEMAISNEIKALAVIETAQTQFSVICPACDHEFEVAESILSKFEQDVKARFDKWQSDFLAEQTSRESSLNAREEALKLSWENQAKEVEQRVSQEISERLKIEYPDLIRKAKAEAKQDTDKEVLALQVELDSKGEELSKLKSEQAELLKEKRELKSERDQFELDKQKAITEAIEKESEQLRTSVSKEYDDLFQIQNVELERARKTIEELNQKLKAKPSQELQGEALELDLETKLGNEFPIDEFNPVKKGQRGADILQVVNNRLSQPCGSILWESKRAQNWGGDWIQKLKQDQREARATVAIIVSQVTPVGIEVFDILEGVWIVKPEFAVVLAVAIREGIIQTSDAQKAAEGIETKAALVYRYLMSDEFKSRFGAIVETFVLMQKQLTREKNAAAKAFNQREKQHETVLKSCFGVIGDLQGIAGQDLKSLEEIEMKALPGSGEDEE
ncbi:MAG: DUF2130 domain-containing protein [Fimbriimonadaceae bacterium]|nr:MAG: DUF2130 domain-containing protein [Fimbriimonadaceae bacterium]